MNEFNTQKINSAIFGAYFPWNIHTAMPTIRHTTNTTKKGRQFGQRWNQIGYNAWEMHGRTGRWAWTRSQRWHAQVRKELFNSKSFRPPPLLGVFQCSIQSVCVSVIFFSSPFLLFFFSFNSIQAYEWRGGEGRQQIKLIFNRFRAIWTHGGPTSAFLHIVIAICLLVPRLLLESRLIENGNLPRGECNSIKDAFYWS